MRADRGRQGPVRGDWFESMDGEEVEGGMLPCVCGAWVVYGGQSSSVGSCWLRPCVPMVVSMMKTPSTGKMEASECTSCRSHTMPTSRPTATDPHTDRQRQVRAVRVRGRSKPAAAWDLLVHWVAATGVVSCRSVWVSGCLCASPMVSMATPLRNLARSLTLSSSMRRTSSTYCRLASPNTLPSP